MPRPAVSACPACGTKVDDATIVFNDRKALPEPGDFTVCLYCAAVSVFDDQLRLRPPTADERREMAEDQRVLRTVAEITKFNSRRN
ncbi:MAG TPA: hypothetical protein VH539_07080 [Gemmatimonadaceae bacterium]|jgi:hypothetical protein